MEWVATCGSSVWSLRLVINMLHNPSQCHHQVLIGPADMTRPPVKFIPRRHSTRVFFCCRSCRIKDCPPPSHSWAKPNHKLKRPLDTICSTLGQPQPTGLCVQKARTLHRQAIDWADVVTHYSCEDSIVYRERGLIILDSNIYGERGLIIVDSHMREMIDNLRY